VDGQGRGGSILVGRELEGDSVEVAHPAAAHRCHRHVADVAREVVFARGAREKLIGAAVPRHQSFQSARSQILSSSSVPDYLLWIHEKLQSQRMRLLERKKY